MEDRDSTPTPDESSAEDTGADSASAGASFGDYGDHGNEDADDFYESSHPPASNPRQSLVLDFDKCPVLAISADRSELHFAKPRSLTGFSGISRREHKYDFVALRRVQLSAGHTQWVGWCNDPTCSSHGSHVLHIFEGTHYPQQSWEEFGSIQPRCEWADAILSARGPSTLVDLLQSPPEPAQQQSTSHIRNAHDYLKYVRVGDSFSGWGAIMKHANSSEWFCTTCSGQVHTCDHLRLAAGGELQRPLLTLGASDFEKKLKKCFNLETGERKLTCLSRQQVLAPDELQLPQNASILQRLDDRRCGRLTVPAVCQIVDPAAHCCKICNGANWGPATLESSLVFLPAAVIQVQFEQRRCMRQDCSGMLTVDGGEYSLLRYTDKLAFSHELLYDWIARCRLGCPDSWTTSWQLQLLQMQRLTEQQLLDYSKYRKAWGLATMDFIQLMRIDYDASFRCDCCKEGVVLDGMTLAIHKPQARLVAPWQEAEHVAREGAGADLVYGSHSAARIMVRNKEARELLLRYCRQGEGLEEQKLDDLRRLLLDAEGGDRETVLLPFIHERMPEEGGNALAAPENKDMLRCLAGTAPACQFMKMAVFGLVDKLIQGGRLTAAEHSDLHNFTPQLHLFLRPHLAKPQLPTAVKDFLKAVKQVAEAAYVPASLPESGIQASASEVRRQQASKAAQPDPERPPELWSREEAMLRTGSFGAVGPQQWQPSHLGGNDVFRRLRRYDADRRSYVGTCTKHQRSNINLLPGCMFYWCLKCEKCVFFHLMSDAESPRTVFDHFFTRWQQPPEKVCMDNGCNLHEFMLNREPEFFKNVEMFIDELHYKGHINCSPAYNTGAYDRISNSSLAEQRNRFLRGLEGQVSYMAQPTFMWYLRFFLHCLIQRKGISFLRPRNREP